MPAYEAVARGAGAGAVAAGGATGAAEAVGPKPSEAVHPMREPVRSRAAAAPVARQPAVRRGLEKSV